MVATELGLALGQRGHHVHFISYEQPFRLARPSGNITFHSVDVPAYPLFKYPPFFVALASKIYEVWSMSGLDVIHAHYAIPHAVAGYLARQMIGDDVKLVTTLHGTDITLLGSEPNFAPAVTFSINASDAVTAVSAHLREETVRRFAPAQGIDVVHNFIDPTVHVRRFDPMLRRQYAGPEEKVVVHVSNFRPVKRPDTVIEVFFRIAAQVPSRLLLVGDGPELCPAYRLAGELGIGDRVIAVGNQDDVVSLLSIADLFLLPSAMESFGLAALEAMACEVPVVASAVGGLPEVVADGVTGYLCSMDDVDCMARHSIALLKNEARRREMGAAARRRAIEEFGLEKWVDAYERIYERCSPRPR